MAGKWGWTQQMLLWNPFYENNSRRKSRMNVNFMLWQISGVRDKYNSVFHVLWGCSSAWLGEKCLKPEVVQVEQPHLMDQTQLDIKVQYIYIMIHKCSDLLLSYSTSCKLCSSSPCSPLAEYRNVERWVLCFFVCLAMSRRFWNSPTAFFK